MKGSRRYSIGRWASLIRGQYLVESPPLRFSFYSLLLEYSSMVISHTLSLSCLFPFSDETFETQGGVLLIVYKMWILDAYVISIRKSCHLSGFVL